MRRRASVRWSIEQHYEFDLREATGARDWDRVERILNRYGAHLSVVERGAAAA